MIVVGFSLKFKRGVWRAMGLALALACALPVVQAKPREASERSGRAEPTRKVAKVAKPADKASGRSASQAARGKRAAKSVAPRPRAEAAKARRMGSKAARLSAADRDIRIPRKSVASSAKSRREQPLALAPLAVASVAAPRVSRVAALAPQGQVRPATALAAASGASGASFGQLYGLHHTPDPLELKSSVALIVDQDTNEVMLSKNTDAVLPIASLTKLMTALVVVDAHLPLDDTITITTDDVDTVKNSSSRLAVGATLTRGELLHLALMSSENRAAHALGRTHPGGLGVFVAQMNAKARALGMRDSRFVDPTGLHSGNQSSAKDLAVMARAAYQHPLIRDLSVSPETAVRLGARQVQFRNTNSLVRNPAWEIGLQKTGYIVEAGRCLVMQATMAGRKVIMVFLDSAGKYSRLADAERVRRWLERSTQGAMDTHSLPGRQVATKFAS